MVWKKCMGMLWLEKNARNGNESEIWGKRELRGNFGVEMGKSRVGDGVMFALNDYMI